LKVQAQEREEPQSGSVGVPAAQDSSAQMEDEPIQGKEEEECPPGIASEAEVVPAAADSEGTPAAEPGKTGPLCSKSTTEDAKATQRKRPAFKKPTAKKIDHPAVNVKAADNKKDFASGARGLLEG
jgi:hypothetical protein